MPRGLAVHMEIQLHDEKTGNQRTMTAEKLVKTVGGKYGLRALWRLEAIGDARWENGDLPKGFSAHVIYWGAANDDEYQIVHAVSTCHRIISREYRDGVKDASVSIKKNWKDVKMPVTCKIPMAREI